MTQFFREHNITFGTCNFLFIRYCFYANFFKSWSSLQLSLMLGFLKLTWNVSCSEVSTAIFSRETQLHRINKQTAARHIEARKKVGCYFRSSLFNFYCEFCITRQYHTADIQRHCLSAWIVIFVTNYFPQLQQNGTFEDCCYYHSYFRGIQRYIIFSELQKRPFSSGRDTPNLDAVSGKFVRRNCGHNL